MKFSFIVPVYNVEKYLEQCVQSILCQPFDDFELILVDDGSTDSSGALCDKLAQTDARIRVIHQENGGLSEARNTGIRNAKGTYILFVDSDDYIAPGILSKINETIDCYENADVVFLEAIKFWPDGRQEPMADGYKADRINGKTKDQVLDFLTTMPKFPGSACTKVIRRELLDESMFFEKGLLSEDIDWCYRLFGKAERYAYLPQPYYYYRQSRQGSISNAVSTRSVESVLWIVEKWAKKAPADAYESTVNSFAAYQYMILIYILSALDKKTAKLYWKRAAKLKWLLSYGKTRKLKLVRICANLMGVRCTSRLLRFYRRRVQA